MRKIEQTMCAAIRDGKTRTIGNTAVIMTGDSEWVVSLHGNTIARGRGDSLMEFTLAGWNTPTTRSRINALLSQFTGNYTGRVYTKNWQPFYTPSVVDDCGRRAIRTHEWVNV